MANRSITVGNRTLPITEADELRYWAKVNKSGPGDCWIWTASIKPNGYGSFRLSGRLVYAHRFAYALAGNDLNPNLMLDHLCHTHACVNPAHLLQVTNAENMANRAGANNNNQSSGIRGVSWDPSRGSWRAYAVLHGRYYHAGYHASVELAELAAVPLRVDLGMANASDLARLTELGRKD